MSFAKGNGFLAALLALEFRNELKKRLVPGVDEMKDADLTKIIIGCAYKVHNALGTGFLEKSL